MADQGFIVNDATVSGIGTSYAIGKIITLQEDAASDANSKALPQAGYLSHLELRLVTASGSPTKVTAYISYDSAGNEPLTGESADNTLHAGFAANNLLTAIDLDVYFRTPAVQDAAGKLHLFIKVDAGTVDLTSARIHWAVKDN